MRSLVLLAAALASVGLAHAEPTPTLPLTRAGDGLPPVTIAPPSGSTVLACGRESIPLLHCLRLEGAGEDAALDAIRAQIVQQGWTLLGETRTTRPFTYVFTPPGIGDDCKPRIMVVVGHSLARDGAAAPPDAIDVMLAQTPDVMCTLGARRP